MMNKERKKERAALDVSNLNIRPTGFYIPLTCARVYISARANPSVLYLGLSLGLGLGLSLSLSLGLSLSLSFIGRFLEAGCFCIPFCIPSCIFRGIASAAVLAGFWLYGCRPIEVELQQDGGGWWMAMLAWSGYS